ncbi:MAG: hypothetical protein NTV94_01965 [Planctomycetota bacterium]|nr:hypothetical protein [Planctomycetota bacterium]
MNAELGGLSRSRGIDVACLLGMLAIVVLRLGCTHEPFPGWSGDPFELPNPIVGITPAASLLLDALAMGLAAVSIWRCGGIGLIQGMELVRDRRTKEPAAAETVEMLDAMRQEGVLCGKGGLYGNVLRVTPPMNISKADVDLFAERLDRAFAKLQVAV